MQRSLNEEAPPIHKLTQLIRPRKKLFPVTDQKNRVSRLIFKKKSFDYLLFKNVCFMHVLLIGSWKGEKNGRVGFFLSKTLLGKDSRK